VECKRKLFGRQLVKAQRQKSRQEITGNGKRKRGNIIDFASFSSWPPLGCRNRTVNSIDVILIVGFILFNTYRSIEGTLQ
jgi:hypothetical protein